MPKPRKFPAGLIVVTAGMNTQMGKDPIFARFVRESLNRHLRGGWGNICQADREENELSLREGFRLLSAYENKGQPEIWIITEADRSVTTVLFPEEY